jgi:hypothetical protein
VHREGFCVIEGRLLRRVAATGALLALAGCQSGGGGFLGMGEPARSKPQEDVARITDVELRAYCPRLVVPENRAVFTTYARGGDGDATKLVLQASLDDSSRACTYGEGTLTMNVAVAGRVVSGPAASGGTVSLPVRITVRRGEEVLFEKVVQQAATASPSAPATQFVVNEPAILIPSPDARNIRIIAGFDVKEPERSDDPL